MSKSVLRDEQANTEIDQKTLLGFVKESVFGFPNRDARLQSVIVFPLQFRFEQNIGCQLDFLS